MCRNTGKIVSLRKKIWWVVPLITVHLIGRWLWSFVLNILKGFRSKKVPV